MKFSLLISIYKQDKPSFVNDALNSIINQSLFPNEIVIVEDGPITEELCKVIDKFYLSNKDLQITRLKLEKNQGLGLALNEGLKYCKYPWIARMDSDDISVFNRFEVMTKTIAKYGSQYDVIGSHIQEFINSPENIVGKRKVKITHNEIYNDFKHRNPMNHVTVFFKKESVLSVGGYQDFLSFEDYSLWARMAFKGYKFMNIPQSLVLVRVGEDMIGRRRGSFYARQELKMQKLLLGLNLISFPQYILNCSTRGFGRYFPKFLLQILYKLNRSK